MQVHLVKKQTIQNYVISHASGKSSFEKWMTVIKYADWKIPEDIRRTFGKRERQGCFRHWWKQLPDDL